ncbi:MAG: GNAT family N-acetyltransferase [Rickettsiales bacterium]|jgi:predicted acetyltransferase|nr:GNAT family N-acetyltransferase [Rickettsiales bacterium]
MANITLVLPDMKYKDGVIAAAREVLAQPSYTLSEAWYVKLGANATDEEFAAFVRKKLDEMNGVNIPEGWVPGTTFWIMDEDGYAGRISLRYRPIVFGHIGYDIRPSRRGRGYAKVALRLVLAEAAKMGIKEAMLTCNENNVASRRNIEGAMAEYGGHMLEPITIPLGDPNYAGQGQELRFMINTEKEPGK